MKLKSLRLKKSEKSSEEVSVGYRPKPTFNKATFLFVFGVLLASASFYEGTVFQRNADTSAAPTSTTGATSNASNNLPANNGGSSQTDSYVRNHVMGEVTVISSSSVTVQEQGGQTATFKITRSTQADADGQSIQPSQIQTGDIVVVTKTSNSSTTASRISLEVGSWGTTSNGSNDNSNTLQQSNTSGQSQLESN